jgi:transposase
VRDGRCRTDGGWRISVFRRPPTHITLQEYRDPIDETARRIERVTEQLRHLAPTWRWAPVVAALHALRGVSFITAVALVAELGDLTRVGHPRELMAYLGLVPAEYSSGPSVRRGAITKAGNPHARRLLAEAAWAYQGIPRIGRQHAYRHPKRTLCRRQRDGIAMLENVH